MSTARLIALDWGTSNLRASLLGPGGLVLESRAAAAGGVMAIADRQFESALLDLVGDWIAAHGVALMASGMIGSRQGWQEAPYLECPADVTAAAARLARVPLSDGRTTLHIVPGLRCMGKDGEHDVMRGEEVQLWGAALADGSVGILPGTHSKWAWMGQGGGIAHFQTYMTGELYALLTQHGILGRLMQFGGDFDAGAFERGVRLGLAEHARATHVIFAARTAGLMERLPPAALPDYLSGLLIGIEIGGATRDARPAAATIIASAALSARYARALRCAGIEPTVAPEDVTLRGQWRLARAAGLIEED